jgi:hypothetical protein
VIVTSDISPEKNLYFLGGKILERLPKEEPIDSLMMFEYLREDYRISFPLFMYTLDWLYLADLIDLTKNGDIKKCF